MRFFKKCLLAAAIGSFSMILAGCYGAPVRYSMNGPNSTEVPQSQNLESETTDQVNQK